MIIPFLSEGTTAAVHNTPQAIATDDGTRDSRTVLIVSSATDRHVQFVAHVGDQQVKSAIFIAHAPDTPTDQLAAPAVRTLYAQQIVQATTRAPPGALEQVR